MLGRWVGPQLLVTDRDWRGYQAEVEATRLVTSKHAKHLWAAIAFTFVFAVALSAIDIY